MATIGTLLSNEGMQRHLLTSQPSSLRNGRWSALSPYSAIAVRMEWRHSTELEHNLPKLLTRLNDTMRLGDILDRQHAIDDRAEATLLHPAQRLEEAALGSHRRAQDGLMFDEEMQQVDLNLGAARGAASDQATVFGEAL
jgi:hypothetical protein